MPMSVEINRSDLASLEAALSGIKNGAVAVLVRTINKTLTSVRGQAAREVTADLNVTQRVVRANFVNSYRATWNNPTAGFIAKGKPLPLVDFMGTRQVRRGVSVKIKKSDAREIIRHAFKNRIWGGEEDVGQRVLPHYEGERKAPRGTYPYRQYRALPFEYRWPVKRLTGPRVEDELGKPAVIARVMAHADERLDVIMEQEINYELSKFRN